MFLSLALGLSSRARPGPIALYTRHVRNIYMFAMIEGLIQLYITLTNNVTVVFEEKET